MNKLNLFPFKSFCDFNIYNSFTIFLKASFLFFNVIYSYTFTDLLQCFYTSKKITFLSKQSQHKQNLVYLQQPFTQQPVSFPPMHPLIPTQLVDQTTQLVQPTKIVYLTTQQGQQFAPIVPFTYGGAVQPISSQQLVSLVPNVQLPSQC